MKQPINPTEEAHDEQCIMEFVDLVKLIDKHDEIFILIPSSTRPLKVTRATLR